MMAELDLWHFCCGHSAAAICNDTADAGRAVILRPPLHTPDPCMVLYGRPMLARRPGARLLWLTDDPRPERMAVGLTSETIACDRMEFRFGPIDAFRSRAHWWPNFADENEADQEWRSDLERFGNPAAWWVTLSPVVIPASHIAAGAR